MDDRDLDLCHDDPIALALLPCPPGEIGQDDHQCSGASVDGRNPAPFEVGSLSLYLQGLIHPRWFLMAW